MSDVKWTVDLFSSSSTVKFSLSYDASTGILGYGSRYGEQSLNRDPLHVTSPSSFWGSTHGPLYNPFLGPLAPAK